MITEEQFEKMDLTPIFLNNKIIKKIENGFYVYLIKNKNTYYVGLSEHMLRRLKNHISNNKNDINNGGEVYILEKFSNYRSMRDMEYIWILWFYINTNCINKDISTHKIRAGIINIKSIMNTNYEIFLQYDVIKGIPLLNSQIQRNEHFEGIKTEEEYFGVKLTSR